MIRHPFHLVDGSPWPLLMSFSVLSMAFGLVTWLTGAETSSAIDNLSFVGSLLLIIFIAIQWWRDVLREAKSGKHTIYVQKGLTIGFLLFLLSEIMLFFSFFWAYFHSSLSPTVELGATWPPVGINPVDAWAIPLLGSCTLLASGFTLTLAHHATLLGDKDLSLISMFITVILGLLFLFLQFTEYSNGEFTIADSVFGSVFYMTTGLHALHVIIGVLFLSISTLRILFDTFTTEHHIGFEFAIYYWHLVDAVWLLVFLIFYWWGS